jgi:Flp pilus assembly protein TadB
MAGEMASRGNAAIRARTARITAATGERARHQVDRQPPLRQSMPASGLKDHAETAEHAVQSRWSLSVRLLFILACGSLCWGVLVVIWLIASRIG